MDRYNDVKILLKKWEQAFFQTNSRKPNKVSGIVVLCSVVVCYAICGFLVFCFILLCYVLSLMFFNVMLFCVFLCCSRCLLIYVIGIVGIFCH